MSFAVVELQQGRVEALPCQCGGTGEGKAAMPIRQLLDVGLSNLVLTRVGKVQFLESRLLSVRERGSVVTFQ